jgi:TP901 family phage tail tape measure protein
MAKNLLEFAIGLDPKEFVKGSKKSQAELEKISKSATKTANKAAKDSENASKKAAKAAELAFNKATAASIETAKQLKRAADEARKFAEATRKAADEAAANLENAADEAEKLAENLATAKLAGQAIGAGFVAAGGAAAVGAVAFSDYAQKLAEVNTLIDVTPAQLDALSDSIRSSSVALGRSATESTEAIYGIISAGVDYSKSVEVMELSTKAAIAGVTDTGTAAKLGLSVINAYGLEVDDLGGVFDVLFQTVKDGVTTIPELSNSLGNVLPTASAAGVSIEEVSASIAAMTKAGINTPQAVTALNGAIRGLAAPAPAAAEAMQNMGIEWKGLTETLGDISKLKLTVAQMREIVPDAEAQKAVLALTNNFDGLQVSLKGMKNAAGAAAVATNKMKDTPHEQLKRFNAAVSDLFLSLGQLVTGFTPALNMATDMVNVLNKLPGPLKSTALLFGIGGTAAASYAIYVSGLTASLKAVTTILPLLTAQISISTAASTTLSTANLALSASFNAVVASIRGAAAAISPLSLLITGIAVVGLNEFNKTLAVANAELDRLDKGTEGVSKISKSFGDLQNELKSLGYGQGQLFKDLQKTKTDLMRAVKEGADADSAAVKKILANASAKVDKIKATEAELQAAKKTISDNEVATHKNAVDAMTSYERLFVSKRIDWSNEAFQKRKQDIQKELDAINDKITKSLAAEQGFIDKIKALENSKASNAISIEDKIRAKKREGLSEEQAQADIRKQINEKIRASKAQLDEYRATGDKESLAASQRWQGQAESLADSLKDTGESAKELKKVGKLFNDIADAQISANQKAKASEAEKTKGFQEQKQELEKLLAAINKTQTLFIEASTEQAQADVKKLEAEIAKLKDKTITITAKTVQTGGLKTGGPVLGFDSGGGVPGYGGGDTVPAYLERGEYVLNKERVRELGGMAAMRQLHKGLDASSIRALLTGHNGGRVRGYREGGPVVNEVFELRAGKSSIQTSSARGNVVSFIDELSRQKV